MQIIIDIPEELYKEIISSEDCGLHELTRAIAKSTPLPKGQHGRLIILSEDAVKREQTPLRFSCQNWISEVGLSNATVAIIEEDTAESKG